MSQIIENASLKPYNTFGIDARARYFAGFSTVSGLKELLHENLSRNILPIGGGSNLLLTKDFDGLVLKNELKGIQLTGQDADYYYIQAAAGEIWHSFVRYCIEHNYAGIENLSLIPGCVGASPMQNIGAYGVEIKDVFHSLEALHMEDGAIQTFGLKDCAFGYRESVFKRALKGQFIILNVTYRLRKHPVFNVSYGAIRQQLETMGIQDLSIRAISDAVIAIRSRKLPDPRITGNAGSFFKNPVIPADTYAGLKKSFPDIKGFPVEGQPDKTKVAAGWMIEKCGWKGFREGDAGVHPRQALVLVNYGKASGKQIFDLSARIIASVREKFGITLEREVNIL